jgi:predicted GNAT family acetyltransferase
MTSAATERLAVTRHDDPMAFLTAAQPVCDSDPATESVFAGWAYALLQQPPAPDDRVHLATCFRGAVLQRDDGPALIGSSTPASARALADDLADDWPALQGVVGEIDACLAFARRWRERTGRAHRLRIHLRQHRLTAVNSVPEAPGLARRAAAADVPWIVAAQLAFVEEVPVPYATDDVLAGVTRRVALGEYRVWEHDSLVAYAGFIDAAPGIARVAPVYTTPAARRRGYATALVAALSGELLARGKEALFLATDVANPTSNAIYARVGFLPLCDQYHFDFVAADDDPATAAEPC